MSYFSRVKFRSCPSVDEVMPYVINSLHKLNETSFAVERQDLLEDVKSNFRGRGTRLTHSTYNGPADPQIDHMIDLALSNLKKQNFIKTLYRGTYKVVA